MPVIRFGCFSTLILLKMFQIRFLLTVLLYCLRSLFQSIQSKMLHNYLCQMRTTGKHCVSCLISLSPIAFAFFFWVSMYVIFYFIHQIVFCDCFSLHTIGKCIKWKKKLFSANHLNQQTSIRCIYSVFE